jgi:Spy/CpxP family protein refolding chaperone
MLLLVQSPYAGQEARAVKALSPEEIRAYLAGEGMGYGKVAELNHYPGPRHVLDHADALALTEPQLAEIRRVHQRMHDEAVRLGAEIVEREAALDALFRRGTIDEATLDRSATEIGRLQGRLRAAHLRAHLATRAALSAEQIQRYDRLRGYHHHDVGPGR